MWIDLGAKQHRVLPQPATAAPSNRYSVALCAEADARRFRTSAKGITLITQPMLDALGA